MNKDLIMNMNSLVERLVEDKRKTGKSVRSLLNERDYGIFCEGKLETIRNIASIVFKIFGRTLDTAGKLTVIAWIFGRIIDGQLERNQDDIKNYANEFKLKLEHDKTLLGKIEQQIGTNLKYLVSNALGMATRLKDVFYNKDTKAKFKDDILPV